MPYNVLANMEQAGMTKSPFGSFLEGRQQKFENALAQKQSDNASRELDLRKQQMDQVLAERQRQAQAAEQAQAKEFISAAFENLSSAQDPIQFSRVADAVAANPISQKLGVTREMITPENVAALRAQLGIAPAKQPESQPLEAVVGPDGKPVLMTRGQAAGKTPYYKPSSGMSVTTPDGTSIQIGGDGAPVKLGKPTQGKLEEAFTNAQANAMALKEQMAKWQPQFSKYSGQASAFFNSIKAKAGVGLSPEETQFQTNFESWKSDTNSLLNQYLNQLSGAAISPAEEKRLRAAFPNTDDDPVAYEAKSRATMRRFALVQARTAYLLSHPEMNFDSVSIDGMQGIMVQEANKLAQAYERSGVPNSKELAIQETRKRYGVDNAQ